MKLEPHILSPHHIHYRLMGTIYTFHYRTLIHQLQFLLCFLDQSSLWYER